MNFFFFIKISFVLILISFIFMSCKSKDQIDSKSLNLPVVDSLILGYAGDSPIAIAKIEDGLTLRIFDAEYIVIPYNNSRSLQSYKEEIQTPSGKTIRLEFSNIPGPMNSDSSFSVLVNGKEKQGPTKSTFLKNVEKIASGVGYAPHYSEGAIIGFTKLDCLGKTQRETRDAYSLSGGKWTVAPNSETIICDNPRQAFLLEYRNIKYESFQNVKTLSGFSVCIKSTNPESSEENDGVHDV